jgi:polyisoprenoid-binding protein YceI
MKRLALALALLPGLALAEASTWIIDPSHSQSTFSVRHLVISNVRGEFGNTAGTLKFDEKDPTKSSVEATIDATTINTREAKRDEHLKSADFFDVAKYPTITFKSTKVQKKGKGKFAVTGDLTLHGVTRPVTLDVVGPTPPIKDMQGKIRRGFSASTELDRKDFGLTWSKTVEAGPVVGDKVKIEIEAETVQQEPEKAAAN